jgi:hypothetical protein
LIYGCAEQRRNRHAQNEKDHHIKEIGYSHSQRAANASRERM